MLQGLVLCGRCGKRMTVRYTVQRGRAVPLYACQRRGIATGQRACQRIPGAALDAAVTEVVPDALSPAALEVALEVFEDLRARQAEVDRLRRAEIERVREEAELARRQFMLVRPEHRLVADTLEGQWNERLQRLAEAEEAYRRATQSDGEALPPADRERIQGLVRDLPRVWHDPRTPMRKRKRMLRLLIEDVTLARDRTIHLQIRWKGGATTSLERPLPLAAPDLRRTPAAVVEMVRALAAEQTDREIAATLNGRWLRSGTGQPFHRAIIHAIRQTYGIPSLAEQVRAAGWLTTTEIAAQLGVHYTTAKRFAAEGVLKARRADGRGLLLFEPPTGALPHAHPGKRFRDRRRYHQCAPHKRNGVQCEA